MLFLGLLAFGVFMWVMYRLIPKPSGGNIETSQPESDISITQSSNSAFIPILYGTRWVKGNILYYGNLKTTPIKTCG